MIHVYDICNGFRASHLYDKSFGPTKTSFDVCFFERPGI